VPVASAHSLLRQMPPGRQRAIGAFLAIAALAYFVLLAIAYSRLTPPSSLLPDYRELDRLIFDTQRPSRVERLLEADGDRIDNGGTMRPAFTVDSVDWNDAADELTGQERRRLLAEREGERQALLEWVRSGAGRTAYERDAFVVKNAASCGITAKYRVTDSASGECVRIRSLIHDRCVTCHSETGRHDTARFIPLDSYERLEPRLKPEAADSNRSLILAVLFGLLPLGLIAASSYWVTAHSFRARALLVTLTFAAAALMLACLRFGQPGTWHGQVLFSATALAALAVTIECLATFGELLDKPQGSTHGGPGRS